MSQQAEQATAVRHVYEALTDELLALPARAVFGLMGEDTAALNYSRTKKMAEFGADELRHLAAKALLPEKLVIDTATEMVRRFR